MKKRKMIRGKAANRSFNSFLFLFILVLSSACQTDKKTQADDEGSAGILSADDIIQKAIEASGKQKVSDHRIVFEFRDKTYVSEGICGQFKFTRIDTSKQVKDVFFKDRLQRKVKGKVVQLADTTATSIKSTINSVNYFVHLPYRLKDGAVKAKRLADDTIADTFYYQLQVKFSKDGGGKDHQDIYRYWFDKKDYSMDYLAYKFYTNDGGMRFRVKKAEKKMKGIVFQDYENLKPKADSLSFSNISEAYKEDRLEKVSKIITQPVSVALLEQECD